MGWSSRCLGFTDDPKRPQGPYGADLWCALKRQIKFGERSAGAVDAGDYDEGVRIAIALRILLHDTRTSASLLGQLAIKVRLRFLDSRPVPLIQIYATDAETGKSFELEQPSALAIADGQPFRWLAPLNAANHGRPRLDFESWWTSEAIAVNDEPLSRKELVGFMAHQDGGAHVDPRGLDVRYRDLAQNLFASPTIITFDGGPDEPFPERLRPDQIQRPKGNAAAVSARQVWYELMVTLWEFADTRHLFEDGAHPRPN